MLHIDRPVRVWRSDTDTWSWRCRICTYDALPYTGTAPTWRRAYADADRHIRAESAADDVHARSAA
jgi:hypothetical protein